MKTSLAKKITEGLSVKLGFRFGALKRMSFFS